MARDCESLCPEVNRTIAHLDAVTSTPGDAYYGRSRVVELEDRLRTQLMAQRVLCRLCDGPTWSNGMYNCPMQTQMKECADSLPPRFAEQDSDDPDGFVRGPQLGDEDN